MDRVRDAGKHIGPKHRGFQLSKRGFLNPPRNHLPEKRFGLSHPPNEFANHPCLRQWGWAYLPQQIDLSLRCKRVSLLRNFMAIPFFHSAKWLNGSGSFGLSS